MFTVLGLTNPDVNLKRMHQLYNITYTTDLKLGYKEQKHKVKYKYVRNAKLLQQQLLISHVQQIQVTKIKVISLILRFISLLWILLTCVMHCNASLPI